MSEPQITHIKDNVDLVEVDGRKFYLVGTAHVSKASVELAESSIREYRPDAVAVELCDPRFQALRDPHRWKNTDIAQVIRSGRALLLLAQLMLAAFQKKLGSDMNVKPGEEMLRASAVAEELKIPIILADRDVKTTLRRTWASISGVQRMKLLCEFPLKLFSKEKIDPKEVEQLKHRDALDSALEELSAEFPGVKAALIDERDKYLAAKIHGAKGDTVVAVIGAGHVPGIKKYIGQTIDCAELEKLPPKSLFTRILTWIIPVLFATLIVLALMHGHHRSFRMLKWWVLITSTTAGAGAALMLAHPLSIFAAALSAPITALVHNPFFNAGMSAAMVEAMVRKPKVSDLEGILDDVTSVRGLWSNRLSRILLIFVLTNVIGMIGAIVAMAKIAYLSHIV